MFCSGFYVLRSRPQIGVTFAIVFGVIFYRISTKAALHMSPNPITRSHVQLTVKTTAAIINLVVILILDEVYGAVARWLTVLGESMQRPQAQQALLSYLLVPGLPTRLESEPLFWCMFM